VGAEYGLARLVELLRGMEDVPTPRALAAACLADVVRFQDGARAVDDRALIVLKREE
jgi:hypothetical protein